MASFEDVVRLTGRTQVLRLADGSAVARRIGCALWGTLERERKNDTGGAEFCA